MERQKKNKQKKTQLKMKELKLTFILRGNNKSLHLSVCMKTCTF